MKLAVVGPHKSFDKDLVVNFLNALWQTHPETIIVSGGAAGVDTCAEMTWASFGGRVISFRPKLLSGTEYGTECWEFGAGQPRVWEMTDVPTGASFRDAAFIRNHLIADECDRLVAFYMGTRTPGSKFTETLVHDQGKPTFAYGLKG